MKIISVNSLAIPEVKVIRYQRFTDQRGYFTETFRRSDFQGHPDLAFLRGLEFTQGNESHSRPGVIRGLHFQWNPYMGKLVRTIQGRMIDLILDIRKGSPTLGKAIAYDLPYDPSAGHGEWIWIPVGFAHGNFFTTESRIEYFCTGEYSPGCEAGISPLAPDIDWSLCNTDLKREFNTLTGTQPLMSVKDREGFTMQSWMADDRSDNFIFEKV